MYRAILFTILTVFTLSCQSKKESKDQPPSTFEKERNVFFSNLKTSDEVALLVRQANVDFDRGLLNDPKNTRHYMSNGVKAAANLGVYIADLNYSIAYQQSDYTAALFTASHELSQSIGIEQGILEFLKNRYYDNISEDDSVKAIMDNLFSKTTGSLKGTVNENLIGIAMATYEIENLHIVLGLLDHYQNEYSVQNDTAHQITPLYRLLLGQRQRVEIIYGFLKSIADPLDPNRNPNFPFYANAFEELIRVYKRMEQEESGPENQYFEIMSDSSFKELSEKVNVIRSKIVSTR